nr:hypothetical protein [Heyndrickxia oleronia]
MDRYYLFECDSCKHKEVFLINKDANGVLCTKCGQQTTSIGYVTLYKDDSDEEYFIPLNNDNPDKIAFSEGLEELLNKYIDFGDEGTDVEQFKSVEIKFFY